MLDGLARCGIKEWRRYFDMIFDLYLAMRLYPNFSRICPTV